MDQRYICRVCGLVNDVPIRDDFGNAIPDERCICCGVKWGEDDIRLHDIRAFRSAWLETGPVWVWPAMEPADWEYERQLTNIPKAFR